MIRARYLRTPDGTLLGVRLYKPAGGYYNYYYYHYNAQGDVVAVTDTNGNVYRQYVYDPYGNIISVKDGSGNAINIDNDPDFNNAYTYRGYRFDPEAGLYFLNSRYYAAGIGRFLTKDTWKGEANNPKSLNRYAYANGDPVNLVDKDGHRADVTGGPEPVSLYNSVSDTPYRPSQAVGSTIRQGGPQYAASDSFTSESDLQSRRPDYTAFTVNGGEVLSIGATFINDYYGHVYFNINFGLGKCLTGISASFVQGTITNYQYNATQEQVNNFLTGWGLNASAGIIYGKGISAPIASTLRSKESGIMIPQIGISFGYTTRLF